MRNRLGEFLLAQPIDRSHLASLLVLLPLVIAIKVLRFVGLLIALPFAFMGLILRLLWRLARLGGYLQKYTGMLFGDVTGFFRVLATVYRRKDEISSWFQQFRCLRRFTSDTRALFSTVPLEEGDLVFLPTVSAVDLMGLSQYLRGSRAACRASWHFLFRRNIYRGRAADYGRQDQAVAGLAAILTNFRKTLPGHKLYFYTDTEELSEQYNRVGVFPFHTLPVPHTHSPVAEETRNFPLRVIYAGDARREKGYQLLPDIIQNVWSEYVVKGKVEFVLQSNYNIRGGEPEIVIARSQMESMPGGHIRLLKEPLSSGQYRDLLLSADINLLLYDAASYYARSSGILVESLAAGVPVIVPAGTWLSRQFQGACYAYQETLRDRMQRLRTYAAGELKWLAHGSDSRGADLRAPITNKVYCWVPVPPQSTHLLVTLQFDEGSHEAMVHLDELDARNRSLIDEHEWLVEADKQTRKATVLLPVAATAARLWFAISGVSASANTCVSGVRLDFLRPPPDREEIPVAAVGLAYQRLSEVPGLLRELIDHHPHYRATAREFAREWQAYHNADRLVAEIAGLARMEARA